MEELQLSASHVKLPKDNVLHSVWSTWQSLLIAVAKPQELIIHVASMDDLLATPVAHMENISFKPCVYICEFS
jgi:hypothetical protein